jgi:MerR family transcriptional regulator, light-induced transcriptional regulator
MNVFTIRDIENLTGIKAHTLRIWEQRYPIFNPKRRESKHRFYDNEDLKFFLRIAYLYNNGYKISRIASLSETEIGEMALRLRPNDQNYEIFINQLTEATIDLDQYRFERILHTLLLHAGFEKSITCVLFPMLKKIGLLWLTGNVIPAQEHFATALIIKKLSVSIDGLERPKYTGGRRVLLFTPCGEYHEIPLLFMQYVLKKQGIPSIYMGKLVTMDMLQEICACQPVSQLYFHLITNLIRCNMDDYLVKLSHLFPRQEIFFSGTCASTCQIREIPFNVRLLKTTEEMMCFAGKLSSEV